MTTLRAAVDRATGAFGQAGIPSPRSDAVALAAFLLGVPRGEVERRLLLGDAEPGGYEALVAERAKRVPLQHLVGSTGFRQLDLAVGPGVFVPRPETELTASLVIEHVRGAGGARQPLVVDLGTGSGAIALTIQDEVPQSRVVAVEVCPLALAWARRNVERLGLPVELCPGDLRTSLEELAGQVDVVVSNPPYVPNAAVPVDPEVAEHDPPLALFGGGPDGLVLPLAVVRRAETLLRPEGLLVMEHGDMQGEALTRIVAQGPWRDVVDHRDWAGRPRVLVAVRV